MTDETNGGPPPERVNDNDVVLCQTTETDKNGPGEGQPISGEKHNGQEPPAQEQQTGREKPQSPEAVTEGGLLDIDGNPFPVNDKIPAAKPIGDDAKDKAPIATAEEAGPTVPTLETPKESTSTAETMSESAKEDGAQIAAEESNQDKCSKKLSNESPREEEPPQRTAAGLLSTVVAEKKLPPKKVKAFKPPSIVDLCDDDDADAEITSTTISSQHKPKNAVTDTAHHLKSLPQEKPLIDLEEYRRKFCKPRKVKQLKKRIEMKKQSKSSDSAVDEAKMPASVKLPKMAIPINLPPSNKMNSEATETAENVNSFTEKGMSGDANAFDRIPSKEVVENMMDRILNRMQSNPGTGLSMEQKNTIDMGGDYMQSGNFGMSTDAMGMGGDRSNNMQSGNLGMMRNDASNFNYMPPKLRMSMDEKMKMMEDNTFGMSFEDKMKMMAMMNMGGNGMNGDGMMDNYAARRMALGMNMDTGIGNDMRLGNNYPIMGGGPSMRSDSNLPGNLQELREMMGKDMEMNRMFNRFNSNSSSNMARMFNQSSKGGANMENSEFIDSIFSRMGSKGSTTSNAMKNSLPEKRDSTGTNRSQSSDDDYLKAPMLPTPAVAKPSLKSNYKDISFSPLDQLHPDLMNRMIALQGNNEGMLSGMPFANDENIKRKFSDSIRTPRSPNPKKSILERHRKMDLQMKGHLDEAMANFGKVQKKYNGGPSAMMGLNNPSTLGSADSAFVPLAATTSGKTKKKKAKKKTPKPESKKTKEIDPRKPKRPFSAYNIFFQLEREAILHRATLGLDLLKDKIEKDYYYKVKNGEVVDEDDPPKPNKPYKSSVHEPPDPSAPDRYRDLILERFWYRAGAKAKRRHRKSTGPSVPFLELTKMISRRWASIDEISPDIKKYCNKLALNELEQYKEDMEIFKKMKFEEEVTMTKLKQEMKQNDSSTSSDASSFGEIKMPRRKRPKQLDKPSATMSTMPGLESLTPNATREQMFDPQFSSRFTDISQMSLLGTPKEQYADPSTSGGSGLPPPPLFTDNNGPPHMNMGNLGGNVVGDRSAALADARRRMLMDMQSMGQGGLVGDLPGGMSSMMGGKRFGGGISDRSAQFSNIQQDMMRNQYLPPGRRDSSSDIINMMMRNRAMGMNLDRLSNPNLDMSGNTNGFDEEVERFLSTLGKEIREKRMMAGSGGADGFSEENRMMMERMMAQRNSANMGGGFGGFSQLPNFQQQLGNDNPQLPEMNQPSNQASNNNSRSSQC